MTVAIQFSVYIDHLIYTPRTVPIFSSLSRIKMSRIFVDFLCLFYIHVRRIDDRALVSTGTFAVILRTIAHNGHLN
jgi:hypothetical protein